MRRLDIVQRKETRFLWRALAHLVLFAVTVFAAGCTALRVSPPWAPQQQAGQPVPTVNALFAQGEPLAAVTPSAVVSETLSSEQILHQLLVDPTPLATSAPAQKIVDEPIFDDYLNANWSTADSIGMRSFFTDTKHVYSGNVGISVTPLQDFGKLFFTVKQNTNEKYGLDRVLGVSVWINSGDQPLDPSDLAITVVGSNDYIYWRPDDRSVVTDTVHFFSESRLYYLGVKNTVPPYTWVEAVVRLDKLPYEPNYKYVTGIYIKNDEWFRRTFYVDQVHLLVVK